MHYLQIAESFAVKLGGFLIRDQATLIQHSGGSLLTFGRESYSGRLQIQITIHGPDGEYLCEFHTGRFRGLEFPPFAFEYTTGTFKLWHRETKGVLCAIRGNGELFEVWFGSYAPHGVAIRATPDSIRLSHGLTAKRKIYQGEETGILIPAP